MDGSLFVMLRFDFLLDHIFSVAYRLALLCIKQYKSNSSIVAILTASIHIALHVDMVAVEAMHKLGLCCGTHSSV